MSLKWTSSWGRAAYVVFVFLLGSTKNLSFFVEFHVDQAHGLCLQAHLYRATHEELRMC